MRGRSIVALSTLSLEVRDGWLPNNLPNRGVVFAGDITAESTLWYVLAIHAYHQATGDTLLVDHLLPVVRAIVEWHVRGTHYGIGMDAGVGLLRTSARVAALTRIVLLTEAGLLPGVMNRWSGVVR